MRHRSILGHPAQSGGAPPGRASRAAVGRWHRAPSRGPSCDARTPRACRTGGGGRRDPTSASATPSRRAARRGPTPSRLTIAAGDSASAAPSGSPQMARMCCSNWEVALASMRHVAAVVDTRRQLVDHQRSVAQQEQLHGQQRPRGPWHRPAARRWPAPPRRRPAARRRASPTRPGCRRRGRCGRPGTATTRPSADAGADHRQLGGESQLPLHEHRLAGGSAQVHPGQRPVCDPTRPGPASDRHSRRTRP